MFTEEWLGLHARPLPSSSLSVVVGTIIMSYHGFSHLMEDLGSYAMIGHDYDTHNYRK